MNRRILIVTQKVAANDPVLGFFYRWIVEFAKHFDFVTVICLEKGSEILSNKIKVLSLGKEKKNSRLQYMRLFYKYISEEKGNYDVVFVHMNPIYVVLGGLFWRQKNKKIFLWYTHKSVDWKLRIAEKLSYKIFTASKESFRLKSNKVKVMGHGIDIDALVPAAPVLHKSPVVLSVGRISPTKNQLAMIQAFEILHRQKCPATLSIVGDPVTGVDIQYHKELQAYIVAHNLQDVVSFQEGVPHVTLGDIYGKADIFINLSATGSLDKVVLEAMACDLRIITSNEAFTTLLPPGNVTDGSAEDIASKIIKLLNEPVDPQWKKYVVANHSLTSLIGRLSKELLES